MADPFLGEIKLVGFNFAPVGWANCDGQLLSISQNSALFSLLGTMYGGDGRTTFGLPDLRGRVPMHTGTGPGLSPRSQGQKAGDEDTTLSTTNMPSHSHPVAVNVSGDEGNLSDPTNAYHARAEEPTRPYSDSIGAGDMGTSAVTIGNAGGGQSFTNMQPYQVVRFIIALQGLYPSRP